MMVPFIGHTGIQTFETQQVQDFAASHYIATSFCANTRNGKGETGFGRVIKRIEVDPSEDVHVVPEGMTKEQAWDHAVDVASSIYRHRDHNIVTENCHHHVSMALNMVEYKGFKHWNPVTLAIYFMLRGKFVDRGAVLYTYGCFAVMTLVFLFFTTLHVGRPTQP